LLDLTDKIGPKRLFRNQKTGKRYLAVTEPNGDVIYAELDENDNPIYAGIRITKDEFNRMLDDLEMVADYNTANFTLFVGKIVKRETPERL
jgi:hypothetical protein